MNRRRRMLAVVLVALAGLGVVTLRHAPHRGAAAHATHDLYYCPMHPSYTSDKPGTCPICSMTLVKREPDQKGSDPKGSDPVTGYAPIRLTEGKQQLIGVKTALAQRGPMTKTIRTVGTVAYDPALYQAEAEYLQAVRALARARETAAPETAAPARALVESTRLRLQVLGLTPALMDEMAGWDGPDRRLLVADLTGRVWVYATVYESELPLVAVGQAVTIEVPSAPGKAFEGRIRAVDPILDAMTRSARVRVELTDPDGLLKPAMFVNAEIHVVLGDRLTVPASAVMATGTRHLLFVAKDDGVLEPREVTVGVRADDAVEIVHGVEAGERVVVSGNFLIDSESRLKAALEGSAHEGHRHGS